ncbi:MAG TPA: hypothetical protein PKY82_02670 [Pyrinomonadaceae bacterium]|nr:hypothetical protein [Pyrinomonadaceae bacterium]
MKRKIEAGVLGILLLGLAVFVGFNLMSSNKTISEQTSYSTDLEKLKTDFNRDKDKVRLVLLLSPT